MARRGYFRAIVVPSLGVLAAAATAASTSRAIVVPSLGVLAA